MRYLKQPSPIMIGDNPLLVGVKVPDPREDCKLIDTPLFTALREPLKRTGM